jgi:hypothetical protein
MDWYTKSEYSFCVNDLLLYVDTNLLTKAVLFEKVLGLPPYVLAEGTHHFGRPKLSVVTQQLSSITGGFLVDS